MPDNKNGNRKNGFFAKIAGIALASGVAWSVYRSIMARREEDALIEKYYGSRTREDYTFPGGALKGMETDVEEDTEEVNEAAGSERQEEVAEKVEKPWFSFGDGKKKANKPKSKPNEVYEIMQGDTLDGISQYYGVSVESLKAANGYSEDEIYAGDKIVIPK